MTAALEGGEWSAARRGRTLPPGETRYPFYRRLGGSQGRSGRAENMPVYNTAKKMTSILFWSLSISKHFHTHYINMFMIYCHTQLHTITTTHFRTKYFKAHSNNKVFQMTSYQTILCLCCVQHINRKKCSNDKLHRLVQEKLLPTKYCRLHKNEKEFTYHNTARDGSTDDTRRKAVSTI